MPGEFKSSESAFLFTHHSWEVKIKETNVKSYYCDGQKIFFTVHCLSGSCDIPEIKRNPLITGLNFWNDIYLSGRVMRVQIFIPGSIQCFAPDHGSGKNKRNFHLPGWTLMIALRSWFFKLGTNFNKSKVALFKYIQGSI